MIHPYFAVGVGADVSLLVKVEKINPDGSIYGHVENGCWHGTFHNDTVLIHYPRNMHKEEDERRPARVIWRGRLHPVLKRYSRDYNEDIAYVEEILRTPSWKRWIKAILDWRLKIDFHVYRKSDLPHGPSQKAVCYADEENEIPF